jgi:hypothetical protein
MFARLYFWVKPFRSDLLKNRVGLSVLNGPGCSVDVQKKMYAEFLRSIFGLPSPLLEDVLG